MVISVVHRPLFCPGEITDVSGGAFRDTVLPLMTELILPISPDGLQVQCTTGVYQSGIQVVDTTCSVEQEVILCVDAAAAVGDIATRKLHALFPLITLPL